MNAGIEYDRLKPVVEIAILDFPLFPEQKPAYSAWSIRNEQDPGRTLNDHLLLCFLELPKIDPGAQPSILEYWSQFVKFEGMDKQLIDSLGQAVPEIAKAHEAYRRFTADEMLRDELEAHERFQSVQASLVKQARREGIAEGEAKGMAAGKAEGLAEGLAEGKAEGEAKKQREIARALLAEGIPVEIVSKASGLSLEELECLNP